MKHRNTHRHPHRLVLYLPPNAGNSDVIHQAALALPSLFVIMFLAIIISLWVSTADAFVMSPNRVTTPFVSISSTCTSTQLFDVSAQEALERTKRKLEELQRNGGNAATATANSSLDPRIEERFREYLMFPANELKRELKSNGLPTKGKKPDLAKRLAEFEYLEDNPDQVFGDNDDDESSPTRPTKYLDPKKTSASETQQQPTLDNNNSVLNSFCGLPLSQAAGAALGKAQFDTPTPIQTAALPRLWRGESAVLHAETGSGKTLAYLLPITEAIWRDNEMGSNTDEDDLWYGLILTPTRELASQVAGVASALAPPGSVRLVTKPTNLMSEGRYWKERRGDRVDNPSMLEAETRLKGTTAPPRLFVGSAKAILGSLYGDGKLPASPTRKPAAKELLSRTRWVVLDEVDRLLTIKNKKGLSQAQRNQRARKNGYNGQDESGQEKTGPLHEKPAAVLTSAVARRTLGRAQVICASATVGRSLKRELSRVLGLPPKEYPQVIQGEEKEAEDDEWEQQSQQHQKGQHFDRAVTIPGSVRNYVLPVDASSTGKLLTSAFFAIKNLNNGTRKAQKTLLVLTKGCGITTTNAIGALKHFRCQPEPQSLLDVLQDANGTDQLMDVHRKVSGSDGVGGQSSESSSQKDGYLLVTGEDTVRGMHLDGLDTVVVVGRANGPDEYIHIAGRTGRAGNSGKVINVLSEAHATAIQGWEKMLNTEFEPISMESIKSLE